MARECFDVVVIGSGFGGAVVACRAAKADRSVLVLERGKLYRPGNFPRSPLAMSTNVWDPSEGLFGLFQLWSFRRLDAVVASGVGGGSLIYANVMLPMPEPWFGARAGDWPLDYADIAKHYDTVAIMMAAQSLPPEMRKRVPRLPAFEDAVRRAGMDPQQARLAVTFARDGQDPGDPIGTTEANLHGFPRRTCRLCGECDLGCNDGAKNTLDFTYLSQAAGSGAEVRQLHEVKRITALGAGEHPYELDYVVHTPPNPAWEVVRRPPDEQPEYHTVRAKRVAVAAGALGSTRLLLANRAGLPCLSGQLGTRFSGNGDAIGFLTGGPDAVLESAQGAVITAYAQHDDPPFFIEDGGYPATLSWLGEAFSPALYGRGAKLLLARWWQRLRRHTDSNISANIAKALGSARLSRSTLPLLAMGLDPASGTMRLTDGRLDLDWPVKDSKAFLDRIWPTMAEIARCSDSRFLRGPSALLSRAVTAHPLGGCPMGKNPACGVVDKYGEAYGHPGLFVVDGSVLPAPVGANPSMTIAALAERFTDTMLEGSW